MLRALYCLDTALHEVGTGKVAEELRYAREAALAALADAERRVYAERAPIEVVAATHAHSLHALYLRPREVAAMLGADLSALRKWELAGLIVAFRHPLDLAPAGAGGKGGRGRERRYRAADVVAFASRHGMPIPVGLLPGAQACDMPPTAFRANSGNYAARVAAAKAARRTKRAYAKRAREQDDADFAARLAR